MLDFLESLGQWSLLLRRKVEGLCYFTTILKNEGAAS
jgi:hypothetical protein